VRTFRLENKKVGNLGVNEVGQGKKKREEDVGVSHAGRKGQTAAKKKGENRKKEGRKSSALGGQEPEGASGSREGKKTRVSRGAGRNKIVNQQISPSSGKAPNGGILLGGD